MVEEDRLYHYEYRLANTLKKSVDLGISIIEAVIEASELNDDYIRTHKTDNPKERLEYVTNGLNIFYNLR